MDKSDNLPHGAPRCGAKNRKNNRCTAFAMKNGRCRFHGGLSTGAKTKEGKARSRRGNWKHGKYSAHEKAERRRVRDLMRSWRELNARLV
jgi:hypothetical protein